VSRSFGLNLTSSILSIDIGSLERIPITFNHGFSLKFRNNITAKYN
jgi:hypothetical protein